METRTRTAPQYRSFESITADNFSEHARQTARALGIDEYELKDLFAAEGASQKLLDDLQAHINAINADAEKHIAAAVKVNEQNAEVADFIATQGARLEQMLSAINEHMQNKGDALIKAQNTRIEDFQNTIRGGRDCYYGNYGYRLDVLKKNLITALHFAAKDYADTHQAIIKSKPYIFNEIFYRVAHINHYGELEYDLFDIRNPDIELDKLANLAEIVAEVMARCVRANETDLLDAIKTNLNQLTELSCAHTKDGKPLFTVKDHAPYLQISAIALEAEQYANMAATNAQEQMRHLKSSEAEIKADFKNDKFVSEQRSNLRLASVQAAKDIVTFRDIIDFRENVAAALAKSTARMDETFAEIKSCKESYQFDVDQITFDNTAKSREALAESYFLDEERRNRIIDKLDRALKECYAAVNYEHELGELLKQRAVLEQEINSINAEAADLVKKAKTAQPPLAYPDDAEARLMNRMKEHYVNYNAVVNKLDELNARLLDVEPNFALDRLDLVKVLPTADEDWDEYLLKRSRVTVRDIGKHPMVIPEEKLSFAQRHPILTGVLIGVGVGIAVAAATVAVITPIGLVATAVAAIGVGLTVGAIVGGSALLAAIGGFIGGLIGRFKGQKAEAAAKEPDNRPQLSTDASLLKQLDHDKPAPKPAKVVRFATTGSKKADATADARTVAAARALREQAARNLKLTEDALARARRLAASGKGKEEENDNNAVVRAGNGR